MKAYYNEWEPFAAQWLRNLIGAGLLPDGDVDERSITDVTAGDLRGYNQCHFFAGIGGWPLALKLAGVPNLECWTGSCPCQPFSTAGEQKGFADERHLWPAWNRLIGECKPPIIFGEQVEAAIRQGWLDLVLGDLEAEGYACGSAVLGAHSVGAPHKRQRLFWAGALGNTYSVRLVERGQAESTEIQGGSSLGESSQLESRPEQDRLVPGRPEGLGSAGSLGDPISTGLEGQGRPEQEHDTQGRQGTERHSSEAGFWDDVEWIECRDGCYRPIKPGLAPLAHGVSGIVGQLHAYGNSLVPPLAGEFVKAFMESVRLG